MRTIAVVLAAAVALIGCGGGDDTSGGADAPNVSTDDLDLPTEPVELPASFPADVPVPLDVELHNAEEHVGETSTIYEVTGWFDGDPIRAARDYEQALEDLGYEVTGRTESPDNLYFVAQDDDWYISAGFFPDPIRNAGASVGVTVARAGRSAP